MSLRQLHQCQATNLVKKEKRLASIVPSKFLNHKCPHLHNEIYAVDIPFQQYGA